MAIKAVDEVGDARWGKQGLDVGDERKDGVSQAANSGSIVTQAGQAQADGVLLESEGLSCRIRGDAMR